MPDDFTQVTVLNKSDLLKKKIIRLMELQKKIGKQLTIILKIKYLNNKLLEKEKKLLIKESFLILKIKIKLKKRIK